MKTATFILFLLLFPLLTLAQQSSVKNVIINGEALSIATIEALENGYNIQIQQGRYWYDSYSGLWGIEGRPVQGIALAGLHLGGELLADASSGTTNVFINGREITMHELSELVKMTQTYIPPGRYWLDANGYAGPAGQAATVNLFQLAARYYGQRNGSSFYRNSYTGMGSGSSGGTFYVIGKDFSYTQ